MIPPTPLGLPPAIGPSYLPHFKLAPLATGVGASLAGVVCLETA